VHVYSQRGVHGVRGAVFCDIVKMLLLTTTVAAARQQYLSTPFAPFNLSHHQYGLLITVGGDFSQTPACV